MGISLTQPIFHHILLKKNDSQVVRTATERQTISKARWLLVLTDVFVVVVVVFTFGMTSLYIKQRIEVLLLCGVLHIDLAIWTLEEGNEIIKWC